MRIFVMGAGGVGSVIAHELSRHELVSDLAVADVSLGAAEKLVARLGRGQAMHADASDSSALEGVLAGWDFVINALAPDYNEAVMRACLTNGANYMDMASGTLPNKTVDECVMAALALDRAWKDKGLTALIDTGITPGITNILVAGLCEEMEAPQKVSVTSYGALQAKTRVSLWSPITLLLDTAAEPLVFLNGEFERAHPFEGLIERDLPGVGKVVLVYHEHEEVSTFPRFIKGLSDVEFRMGDPGILRMKALYESGFLSRTPVAVDDVEVAPLDLVAAMTPPTISPEELEEKMLAGDVENGIAVRLVEVEGEGSTGSMRVQITIETPDLRTTFADIWGANHVSFATGVSAAAFAKAMIEGKIADAGVFPPEAVSAAARRTVLDHVEERGFKFVREVLPMADGAS